MNKEASSRRRNLTWLGTAALIVVLAVLIRGYIHHAEAADKPTGPPPAVPVTVYTAAREQLPVYVTGIGTVQANASVTVKVRVDGQLDKIAFAEGQDVKTGDLLAQIDARPYQAALEVAKAQKAKDEALLKNGQIDLVRYNDLVANDSISHQVADTQRATVDQEKAAVDADAAQVDSAEVNLSFTTIRSPISGRTGVRLVDAGNIVHAADATGIVIVNQITPIAVLFTLPDSQFQLVNRAIGASGKKALQVQAFSRETNGLIATGELVLINNQIDPTSGTVELKAIFANPDHVLWPGQYVNIHLVTGIQDVVTIPQSAIVRGTKGLYTYVVMPDATVNVQPVTVVLEQDGKSIIGQGVAPGTKVVTEGQYKLRQGVKVAEAKPVAGGPSPAAPPQPSAAGSKGA